MIDLIKKNHEQINALCRKHGVKTLELFGSAASGEFDPQTSDVDFFVEFSSYGPGIADHWFGLGEDLEALLGRKVNLVSSRAATNRYFREVANEHRIPLYAAPGTQAA